MVAAVASCDGQSKPNNLKNDNATPEGSVENALPIDEYVVEIFEDSKGNLWFGSRVAENDHPDPAHRKGDGGLSRHDGKTIVQHPEIE
jgi:hypothetical protein